MPGSERRTRLTPAERRKQLIAFGVNALADRPLEEVTIEFLAAEAGVSRGLVFYYFNSKTGLHHELVRAARDSLMRATEPKLDLAPSERLHDTLERFVTFARDHSQTFFSLVRGAASGDETVRTIVDEVRTAQAERLSNMFGELGVAPSSQLHIVLRSWVSLAEQALIDGAVNEGLGHEELVGFLERSCIAVVELATPAQASDLRTR